MTGLRITAFSGNPLLKTLQAFLECALEAADPRIKIRNILSVQDDQIILKHNRSAQTAFRVPSQSRIWIFGAGKAAAKMAAGVEDQLGSRIFGGYVLVSRKIPLSIEQHITDHPIPGRRTFRGTGRLLNCIDRVDPEDVVIFLISGGASSMLEMPADWIGRHDLIQIYRFLLKSGANINDINTLRPLFSKVKGGRLAFRIFPARSIGLIVSDVCGDNPEMIGSGPTVPHHVNCQEAEKAFVRTGLMEKMPHLWKKLVDQIRENEKEHPTDKEKETIYNHIIINNMDMISAVKKKAVSCGYFPVLLSRFMSHPIERTSEKWISAIHKWSTQKKYQKICLIAGGEPTVKLHPMSGLGGRNQELVLRVYRSLRLNEKRISFCSMGTDGIDGNTGAAGACFCLEKTENGSGTEKEIDKKIREHDSWRYFKKHGGHILTGPTGTNVMDLQIGLIDLSI